MATRGEFIAQQAAKLVALIERSSPDDEARKHLAAFAPDTAVTHVASTLRPIVSAGGLSALVDTVLQHLRPRDVAAARKEITGRLTLMAEAT